MIEVRRWIAERLFERELDEDYYMGLNYGQDVNKQALIRRITDMRDSSNKKNLPGIELILEALR
jgi:hypothetical protein